jgi:hypothetical protein
MLIHAKDCVVSVFVLFCFVLFCFSRKVVLLLDSSLLALVGRFVVLLYDKSSQSADLNKARHMLSKKVRSLEEFPQTQFVLHQHIRRVTFQGGDLWRSVSGENPVVTISIRMGMAERRQRPRREF